MNRRSRIISFLILTSLLFVQDSFCDRIQGDFDGNGIVDFQDFLIFAGNFGKTGDPFDPNMIEQATVYDTVKVFVQKLLPDSPPEDGAINGLASVHIAFPIRTSWDADSDTDGIQFLFWLKDSSGNTLSLTEQEKSIEVILGVSVFENQSGALALSETWKGQIGLFYNNSFGPYLRIEREKLEPFDNRQFNLSVKLITSKQGTFEAKVSYSLMTEEPKGDYKN